jgi:hypothetical protein
MRRKYGSDYKLEQLIDRLMYRPKGASATAESWHRDNTPGAQPSDHTFGGWWNLDAETQKFSYARGTHLIHDDSKKADLNTRGGCGTMQDCPRPQNRP